jgi:hypothetical protein
MFVNLLSFLALKVVLLNHLRVADRVACLVLRTSLVSVDAKSVSTGMLLLFAES